MKRAIGVLGVLLLCVARPAAAQNPKPLVTADTNIENLTAEVIESSRKDNVLTVRIRLRYSGEKPASFTLVNAGYWGNIYLSAEKTKYDIIRDEKGYPVATPSDGGGFLGGTLKKGGVWTFWAKFPAPPAEVKRYAFYWPVGPPVEDIPITDRP